MHGFRLRMFIVELTIAGPRALSKYLRLHVLLG